MKRDTSEPILMTQDPAKPEKIDQQVGIRSALNQMGISNDKINFNENTKMVTINGRDFMAPSYLDEKAGVSYATLPEIQKNLTQFYKDSANPVVRVSDAFGKFAGEYGLSADALGYSNGTVTIGGMPLDVLYIDNEGKAWAWQNQVEKSVTDYANQVAVQSPVDLHDQYVNQYLSKAEAMFDQLENREAFSYNPETDPVFQAYRQQYQLASDRSVEDVMASYATLTGGYGNSAAMTAGAQTAQYYAQQLSAVVPELAKQAYQRYQDQFQNTFDLFKEQVNLYDNAYKNAASANIQQAENAVFSVASSVERDQKAREERRAQETHDWAALLNQNTLDQTTLDALWDELLNSQKLTIGDLQIDGLELDNEKKEIFLRYYSQLLSEELQGEQLKNLLTRYKLY